MKTCYKIVLALVISFGVFACGGGNGGAKIDKVFNLETYEDDLKAACKELSLTEEAAQGVGTFVTDAAQRAEEAGVGLEEIFEGKTYRDIIELANSTSESVDDTSMDDSADAEADSTSVDEGDAADNATE